MRRATATSLLLLAGLGACSRAGTPGAAGPPPWFEEAAVARGLVFTHTNGHRDVYWMPEITGGGGALLDPDGDGDLDAYLVQSGSLHADATPAQLANALFANDGSGHFRDVSAGSGAEDPRYGMGVACADADGDGRTDLFVTNVGRCSLLRNEGALRFSDGTEAAGLAAEGWHTSAAFLDHDRDGDLDLFVVRYLNWTREGELTCMDPLGRRDYCSPKNYKASARDLLYRNEGGARFADVSRASGVWADAGNGLGVAVGDLDQDGWLDVLVANDGTPTHLWRNQGDGTFANVALATGCAVDASGQPKAGMGVLVGDLDGDLDLDALICNLRGEADSYYRNDGGLFSDRTAASALAVLSKPFTRFGMALGDFDQDGWLDLYQANGRVERPREGQNLDPDDPYAEPNLLLAGGSDGKFREVLPRGGTRELLVETTRALAQGDVDGDGALDLLVVNNNGPAQLLLGRAPARGNWVLVRVLEASGADALGAELTLEVGGKRVRRDVSAAFGYLASHDARVHLGLGAATQVDGVLVRWVDGTRERFAALAAGAVHTLRRGQGSPP